MNDIDTATVQRFRALFDGLQRLHGAYDVTGVEPDERGKRKGKALTLKQPVTDELVGQHLAGKQSLGMVPVRDDATVRFGAIDIDVYADLNASAIAGILVQEGLPLIPCQSKSGACICICSPRNPCPPLPCARGLPKSRLCWDTQGRRFSPGRTSLRRKKKRVPGLGTIRK